MPSPPSMTSWQTYNQQTGESKIVGYTYSQDLQVGLHCLPAGAWGLGFGVWVGGRGRGRGQPMSVDGWGSGQRGRQGARLGAPVATRTCPGAGERHGSIFHARSPPPPTPSPQIKVNDLQTSLLSDVIDTANAAGGNNLTLNSVTLQVSPSLQHTVMKQARAAAVKDAADTATLLASAAGVQLGAPMRITDHNKAPVTSGGGGGGGATRGKGGDWFFLVVRSAHMGAGREAGSRPQRAAARRDMHACSRTSPGQQLCVSSAQTPANRCPATTPDAGAVPAAYARVATPIAVGTTTVDASVTVQYNFTTAQ